MERTSSVSVDQAGGATATLIAAKTGYKVEITGFVLSVGGAAITVKSTLQDSAANTVRMTMVGNATTPVVYSHDGGVENPAFETAVSEGVELVTGAASAISGFINYRYIPGA
jgi:hypothetical protein